jgi:hypothetical protein
MRRVLIGCIAAASLGAGPSTERLDGSESAYTERLARILMRWPPSRNDADSSAPVQLTCIATADAESYVGILRRAMVRAPIGVVESVLDDVAHYKDLLPGTVDVRVVPGSRQGNRFATAWEQRIPVFFLPNVTYELSHLVDKTRPGLSVYRYQLIHSETLVASDGMVVLESAGPNATRFTEYGFFDVRPSPLPASVVWRESVRGAFIANVAIKLKAENPAWSYPRIAAEAERLAGLEADRIEQCLGERHANRLDDDRDSRARVKR